MKTFLKSALSASLFLPATVIAQDDFEYSIDEGIKHLVAKDAVVERVGTGYRFTEGGARDAKGNVYFTDIPNERIHKWDARTGEITVFKENSGRANGTWVDGDGNLIACLGGTRGVASIAPDGSQTILATSYKGGKFNSPNDLWMDSKGGIYFTDPRYGQNRDDMEQDGEHVYYLSPDRSKTIRVADDFTRPNGIIGTKNGKTLYIADHGGKKTFAYDVEADGTLSNKRLFAEEGSDGLALDNKGNVYLTAAGVRVYSSSGEFLGAITLPKRPSNVAFGGKNAKTLFITSRDAVYTLPMKARGVGSN